MPSIYEIENDDLGRLNSEEATRVFQQLLWAEARRIGIPISKVHMTLRTTVPDGGIDASVEECELPHQDDLIKLGLTSYQIKASASQYIHQRSQVQKELFGDKEIKKENLGSAVRDCLKNRGTYIYVNFSLSPTAKERQEAVNHFLEFFSSCGFPEANVEVWGQTEISGFINCFPSLALEVQGTFRGNILTHYEWSKQAEMRRPFVAGIEQQNLISSIGDKLLEDDTAMHIKIRGEAGIGKTRTILESTRKDYFSPLVIYTKATSFIESDLYYSLLRTDSHKQIILVIDECDLTSSTIIWNQFKYSGPRIKIITINNEIEQTTGNTIIFDIPYLEDEQILEIFGQYGIPSDEGRRWVEFCGGSPRVAHILCENLSNNPTDLLRSPDTVNVWERYIAGLDDLSSNLVQERRLVLKYLSLFKKFGYGAPVEEEAMIISKKIEAANPSITWTRFQEIVKELRERRILQGETTLYISPRLLHIKLWRDWWETFGNSFDFDEFTKDLTPHLLDWFFEMFKYAGESQQARLMVRDLLSENGPFFTNDLIRDKLGARFFLAITEGHPKEALSFLKKYFGDSSTEDLLNFRLGRREVIWALERIVVWKDFFLDGARLLLSLAEAENESYANNASGIFTELFVPGWGKLAITEASPSERFPVIVEAIESESKKKRLLGYEACKSGLQTSHFSRMIGAEFQGLSPSPQLWSPETWDEIFDSYRNIWGLLTDKLPMIDEDEQQKVLDILLLKARGLIVIPKLHEMIISTLELISREPYHRKNEALKTVIHILHFDRDKMSKTTLNRLTKFKETLEGKDFHSQLVRFVGLDLMEDKFNKDGTNKPEFIQKIKELAQQANTNKDLLLAELPWLVYEEPPNGYIFGYELGMIDTNNLLLADILDVHEDMNKKNNLIFLGGYLRALNEKGPAQWELLLDSLTTKKTLVKAIPELTWRSGISEESFLRLLQLAKSGEITYEDFKWLGLGQRVKEISEKTFTQFIHYLFDQDEKKATSIALEVFSRFYLSKDSEIKMPRELTLQLLTDSTLFSNDEKSLSTMDYYHWEQIGLSFISEYPELGLDIAEIMLENFGEAGTIVSYSRNAINVLEAISRQNPKGVWKLILNHINPPLSRSGREILNWLRGYDTFGEESGGALYLFPPSKLWDWIDEDIENRAPLITQYIPKSLERDGKQICFPRELLIRYGYLDSVKRNLSSNFSLEAYTGSRSIHLLEKLAKLKEFKEDEENQHVISWIDQYMEMLQNEYKQAKIDEEREIR